MSSGAQPPSAHGSADGVDFYRNAFVALPMAVPSRPQNSDDHGARLHPKPTVHGTQTAIVVSDDAPLLTDRDHRIKVQFPWPHLERRWRIACVLSTLLYGGILAGMTVIGWTMEAWLR